MGSRYTRRTENHIEGLTSCLLLILLAPVYLIRYILGKIFKPKKKRKEGK